jgi:hypothetical protein
VGFQILRSLAEQNCCDFILSSGAANHLQTSSIVDNNSSRVLDNIPQYHLFGKFAAVVVAAAGHI